MVKPTSDRPYEGMMTINCEISPMASSEFEQGRYVPFPDLACWNALRALI